VTTSDWALRIGSIIVGISFGSCWPSASSVTKAPAARSLAALKQDLIAAPYPLFSSCLATYYAPGCSAISRVPPLLPSSTRTTLSTCLLWRGGSICAAQDGGTPSCSRSFLQKLYGVAFGLQSCVLCFLISGYAQRLPDIRQRHGYCIVDCHVAFECDL